MRVTHEPGVDEAHTVVMDIDLVLRRIEADEMFASAVRAEPVIALFGYTLSADDLRLIEAVLTRSPPGAQPGATPEAGPLVP